jgi:carbamoyltransferase
MKEERKVLRKRERDPIYSLYDFDTEDDVVYSFQTPSFDSSTYEFNKYIASKKYNIVRSYDFTNSHHLIHANLAFYDSGFNESLVFVLDRDGSIASLDGFIYDSCRESESVYVASYPNNFKPIYKNYWTINNNSYDFIRDASLVYPDCEFKAKSQQSITKVYETATSLILQPRLENGKTMGLSAYGNKDVFLYDFFTDDAIAIDHHFGHQTMGENHHSINLDFQKLARKDIDKENYQVYADYAWQVQKQTQEALARLVDKYVTKTGIKNVCITGGYGLNVVANYYLVSQFPDINFFFEPIADDSGNSIGSAMKAYRDETLDKTIYPLRDTFFNGSKYVLDHINGKDISIKEVAELISKGKSVAVYQGLSEAGPRALGNRSILFDPRDKNAKDKVNNIKKREWYRPFAGMVLEEDAPKFFNMGHIIKSQHMTISFPVLDSAIDLIPGVVHIDNTCRIQTIDKSNKNIFELLKEFKELTGIGVILNTSFNLAGYPLVETPQNALDTLKDSELDFVWFPEISKIVSKDVLQS